MTEQTPEPDEAELPPKPEPDEQLPEEGIDPPEQEDEVAEETFLDPKQARDDDTVDDQEGDAIKEHQDGEEETPSR